MAPPPLSTEPPPAPTKASLKAWWRHFTFIQKLKKEPPSVAPAAKISSGSTVFGKPLRESLRYASVHISTSNAQGELYVWGYIPVVVAKCGLYLKENATEVQGTFRVSGSNKRMRELQTLFDTPPRYGKDLDWSKKQFTTHDVASVFRRYLTQMPEPVIPHDRYHDFRNVLTRQPPLSTQEAIETYKHMIQSLPRANQYLLLYVLDLLSVFARKSDKNLMTAQNLATIFRPGIINHPTQELAPAEHKLSQEVLEFLIAHQDWFMMDVTPPTRRDSILGPAIQSTSQDVLIVPTDKDTDPAEGNWNFVETRKPLGDLQNSIDRRRTTYEKGSSRRASVRSNTEVDGSQPPRRGSVDAVGRSEDDPIVAGAASVKRSTTVPSRRSSLKAPQQEPLSASTNSPPGSTRRRLTKPPHDSKFSTSADDQDRDLPR
ncbi:hypothetical protein FS837_007080 [Tulasnella sp. UAMH 9824]|nr:hypothetical protein FS837_007080 [Tulasnella sp. UAMH 9824]